MIVQYKGTDIYYTDQGEGQSIILLHGFLENSTMWKDLILNIAESNRVIAIDLLGHGQTGCLGYIHSMEMMAEAVNHVLVYLNVENAIFIGHSMGGYVALAYAELFPKKLQGLCLMNSTALADIKEKQKNRDRAVLAVKQNHRIFIGTSISNLFAPENREKLKNEIEKVKEEALKMPLQGIIAALEGMKCRKNRQYILQATTYKKMMIIGRKDPVLDNATLLEQLKGTNVHCVEFSGGHMSHIENKKELTYNILHFIEN